MQITATQSSALKIAARIGLAVCVVLLVTLSLLPAGHMPRTPAPKIFEHFVAYAGTAVFAVASFTDIHRRSAKCLAVLIGFAGVLEYAQRFSPGRESGWNTFIASSLGAAAGVALASLVWSRLRSARG
jgi:VanZ family protein